MPASEGMGARGTCVCLVCGTSKPHEAGVPCREERCPKCGRAMVREGSAHHLAFREKKKGEESEPR